MVTLQKYVRTWMNIALKIALEWSLCGLTGRLAAKSRVEATSQIDKLQPLKSNKLRNQDRRRQPIPQKAGPKFTPTVHVRCMLGCCGGQWHTGRALLTCTDSNSVQTLSAGLIILYLVLERWCWWRKITRQLERVGCN